MNQFDSVRTGEYKGNIANGMSKLASICDNVGFNSDAQYYRQQAFQARNNEWNHMMAGDHREGSYYYSSPWINGK